ncbi:MAG: hypothetical protein BZY88_00655 [SAR202 cluster bacterium Io17-Chloro-G9]|nr:MAG: hypothetical protein BZY88_00655 [SAR202 cluster bacterium Io17-Chloro-G9]
MNQPSTGDSAGSSVPEGTQTPITSANSPAAVVENVESSLSFLQRHPIFTLTGRTVVWQQGWELFKDSPIFGRGFHADRIILRNHMHNTFMHSIVQTGVAGTIPLMAALILTWWLLLRAVMKLAVLPDRHRYMVIQIAGVVAFLSIRTITESTGAFFGVDWLVLAPMMLYLELINRSDNETVVSA